MILLESANMDVTIKLPTLNQKDKTIAETFTKIFSKREIVHFNVSTTKVEYKNRQFTLHLKLGNGKISKISGDALLVATGIKPNTVELGLENTKIKTN